MKQHSMATVDESKVLTTTTTPMSMMIHSMFASSVDQWSKQRASILHFYLKHEIKRQRRSMRSSELTVPSNKTGHISRKSSV